MATHSSVLVWRIPGTGEPGGLPSMGSHRVGHNCSDLAALIYVHEHWETKSDVLLTLLYSFLKHLSPLYLTGNRCHCRFP